MNRQLSNIFKRSLEIQPTINQKCLLHVSLVNKFQATEILNGEPMKAKKRIDPQVLLARENRKRKRIEKQIKSMEKLGRKLKPIEESEPDRAVLKDANLRNRGANQLIKEEEDEEFFLKREWANYMAQQHAIQMEQIKCALKSQEVALKELKKDNLDLYEKAIQLDSNLLPYTREGPVHTPPNKIYEPPEGDYNDVTYLYDRRL